MYRNSAPKNSFQSSLQKTSSAAVQPVEEQDRISYGIVLDVNEKSRVKVKMFRSNSQGGDLIIAGGSHLPVLQPLSVIHMLYGPLRKGLVVRLFWKGKLEPKGNVIIEVIGNEDHQLATKELEVPALDQQPYKIFSGGTIPI